MRGYLDRGYTAVKMKIGGVPLEDDLRRIEAVLGELAPGQQLAVDANGRFDLGTAIAYAKALSQYDLFWYEEAGDPLTLNFRRSWRTTTQVRLPQAKTCSPCRTHVISFATAGCVRTAIGSSSTAP
jgi:L-alanine-DL-glutamate epimerase-like enolase superfamily enzyme